MEIFHEESVDEDVGVSESQYSEQKELVAETEECSDEGGVSEVGYELRNSQGQDPILVHQLPRKGLSFQLWPAATALCWYLDTKYGNSGMQVGSSDAVPGVEQEVSGVKRRMRVLELGAGTGMVGVLAARLGAHVTLTDLAHVLPNLERNVELNKLTVEAAGGSLSVHRLEWGVKEDVAALGQGAFDLILASDVVYYDTLFEPLAKTLKWLVGGDMQQEDFCLSSTNSDNQLSGHSISDLVGEGASRCGIDKQMPKTEDLASPVVLLAHLRRWKKDKHFFRMACKFFHLEAVHQHPPPDSYRTGVVVYRLTRHVAP